jgi:probable O-glycosylation ligase (exosortase A-associated)
MLLTAIATLGTHSRGALLGLCIVMSFLILKSRRKALLAALAVFLIPLTFVLMPQKWFDRMDTMRDFEQDGAAMGRVNAWWFAINLASDRPLLGGGFDCFTDQWFAIYAPNPGDVHDAHSIYFEVLGEQGFVGLFLFLTLAGLTWRSCSKLGRLGKHDPETVWISDLSRMVQVSILGYAITGAFVGLAYFDLYYNLVAIVVVAKLILHDKTSARELASGMNWNRPLAPVSR